MLADESGGGLRRLDLRNNAIGLPGDMGLGDSGFRIFFQDSGFRVFFGVLDFRKRFSLGFWDEGVYSASPRASGWR